MSILRADLRCLMYAASAVGVAMMLSTNHSLGAKPDGETTGNNLSFPVIWAEGVDKPLRGEPGMLPQLEGDYEEVVNADGELVRAYVQKDPDNVWQATAIDAIGEGMVQVAVHEIDWGDNLEAVDWNTRSKVRTEVVLYHNNIAPLKEYEMAYVSGLGMDEVHGLAATNVAPPSPFYGPGDKSTVYSPLARLTIQKLHNHEDPNFPAGLEWNTESHVWQDGVMGDADDGFVNEIPIYNMAVWEGDGDGPAFYSAEINVKGKVIYGYTWDVKKLNEATINDGIADGFYRMTFSLDDQDEAGNILLNTSLSAAKIMLPDDDELELAMLESAILDPNVLDSDEGGDTGGGVAEVLGELNLTYIDVYIEPRDNGGGGGKGGGGKDRSDRPGNGIGRATPEPTTMGLMLVGIAIGLRLVTRR